MTLRRFGALTAFIASAITIALLVAAGLIALDRQGRENVDRYGSTIAKQVAGLAASGVAMQNPVPLNIIVAHVADDPSIINAAIFTQDHRLLSSGGRTSTEATYAAPAVNVFKHGITFEGQQYGYVRVVVDPLAIAPSMRHWLWLAAALAAVLAAWCGALLGGFFERELAQIAERLEQIAAGSPTAGAALARLHHVSRKLAPDAEPPQPDAADAGPPPYLVVLNLFNLRSLTATDRDNVLAHCTDRVEEVCDLYDGYVARLPNTGLFVLFDVREDHDHAFHAICATLLAMRLMTDLNAARVARGERELLVRAGVLRLTQPPAARNATALRAELEAVLADGILLSATARNSALLADREVFQALTDAQRLHWTAVRTPITTSRNEPGFHYQITGVASTVEPLLAKQARRLIEAAGARWSAGAGG